MKELINQGTIIDVRTKGEYQQEHFPGAINIPLDQLGNHIDKCKEMKKPIVTYCQSGTRSGLAVSILRKQGIVDTINAGGLGDIKKKMK